MRRWAEYLALAASAAIGVWLLAAPYLYEITGSARISLLIVGPVAASIAIVSFSAVVRGLVRVNLVLGAWLVVAAALLDYGGSWYVSAGAGALLAALSLVPKGRGGQFGGGWATLLPGHRLPGERTREQSTTTSGGEP